MTDLLFSNLLIVFLCIPVLLRPFAGTLAQNQSRRDAFAIIPLISLFICLLSIVAFSLEFSNLILLIFSLIVFFFNLNRFISFCMQLQRDYFNGFFKIFSLFLLVILLFLTALIYFYKPSPIPSFNADLEKTLYHGSSSRGFYTRKTLFDPITAVKTECFPVLKDDMKSTLPTVLYIPDICTSTSDALEQLLELSEKGCRVISFDFYPSDIVYINSLLDSPPLRSFSQRIIYAKNPSFFEKNNERFQENKEREIFSALSVLQSENLTPLYIIAEGFTVEGAKRIQERYPQSVADVFITKNTMNPLNSSHSGMAQLYKTKGLDLILLEQTSKTIEADSSTEKSAAQRIFELVLASEGV